MSIKIEMRLTDNGKWNKNVDHIANEMKWNIHKEFDNIAKAGVVLEELIKKRVFYEYRMLSDNPIEQTM